MSPELATNLDPCFQSARQLASMVRARELSARELMVAYLARIERINPRINAIVAKLGDDRCLALADEADRRVAGGEPLGALHGLPIAFKELEPAVGFPWTRGSTDLSRRGPGGGQRAGRAPARRRRDPDREDQRARVRHGVALVQPRLRHHAQPYDTTKSAGGSSGGAGAALAAGLLPIADGSDLGGSLRNPANFNNIVALRPTVGLVPMAPVVMPFHGFGVKGPMARSVADVAWLLSVMAGPDARDPACYPCDPAVFAGPLERSLEGVCVAWSPDLGGLPLDRRVRAVLESQRRTFEELGCIVEEAAPDLSGADEVFLVTRAWRVWSMLGPFLAKHRDEMKPEAIGEIERGARLTAAEITRALVLHGEILERMRRFQEKHEFLLCAVNQVPPFDATLDWPKEIEGVAMDGYIAWMRSAYWITTTFRPAISVPAGFTPEGLPVGIQIVGRYRDDLGVLRFAHMFEQATGVGRRRPPI